MTTNDIDAIRKLTNDASDGPWETGDDAEFIAAARTLVPALCDEIDRLRAQVAELANKLHRAEAENASLKKAGDHWDPEVAELRQVVEAAKAWCEFPTDEGSTGQALRAAVDALPAVVR